MFLSPLLARADSGGTVKTCPPNPREAESEEEVVRHPGNAEGGGRSTPGVHLVRDPLMATQVRRAFTCLEDWDVGR